MRLVARANLHGLHAGFGFGPGLERAVVDDRGRRRGRLGVDDSALLGGGVAHDIDFLRTCRLRDRGGGESQCADHQNFFQSILLGFVDDAGIKPPGRAIVPLFPE